MNKSLLVIICLVLIFLLVAEAATSKDKSAKSGKSRKKKEKKVDDRKPVGIEPDLYCNACQASVREILKKVRDSRKEYDIIDAVQDICNDKHYPNYEYPPPDMKKGCEAFYSGWAEEVEKAMINRANNQDVENEICIKKTKACVGNKKKGVTSDNFVTVNGKKMPVGKDGKVDMNADPYEDI